MQIKSIAMLAITGCLIGLSTGCIKQEEYDNMVLKLTTEKNEAVTKLESSLADKESLLKTEQERARNLQNDLSDSTALNDELKQSVKETKGQLADAQGQISKLESKLTSANATIKTAQSRAADAENEASAAQMQAQETQRRFDALVENLIRLNKIKPGDVGFENLSGASAEVDMGAMEESSSMEMEEETGSDSAADLLDQMGNM